MKHMLAVAKGDDRQLTVHGRRQLLWFDDGCTNDHNDDISK